MRIKVKILNEILTTLDEKEFLMFLDSYKEESRTNPFLNKYLNERLRNKEIVYQKDEKNCDYFFNQNKEILEEIDKCSVETRNLLGSYIILLNIVYHYLGDTIDDYKDKTKELENLGIDNIIFGFNPIKRKTEPIIVSKNLKTYIKMQNNQRIDSLQIFSNGTINKAKLSIKKQKENDMLACVFDLNKPTFVLETNQNTNDLYLLGTDIDLEEIKDLEKLKHPNFTFNDDIEKIIQNINLTQYDYYLEINYPKLIGKTPKQIYK